MKVMLKELGEIITGNTPSKQIEEFWNSEDICFIKPDVIADSGVNEISESNEYISEGARKKARVVSNNAIFVTCIGSIGKIGIAMDGEYAFNQQINAIIPNEKIDSKYLAYNLLFNKQRLIGMANAPVVPIINKSQFGEFTLNIEIDSDKQFEIVKVLDKLTNIIKHRENELFSLNELIKARFVEMFGDQEYEKKRLIELIQEGAGLSYGIVVPGDNVKDGIPMIRPSDFKNGSLSLDNVYRVASEIECKYKKTRLFGDEILVQVIGQPGQVMLSNERCKGMNVTRNLAVIRIDKDKANRLFISHYLSTEEAQFFMFGSTNQSTLKQLPLNKLKELPIPIVPVSKQNQFADFVNQVDKSKVVVQKALDETKLLFDSLMQKYFG